MKLPGTRTGLVLAILLNLIWLTLIVWVGAHFIRKFW